MGGTCGGYEGMWGYEEGMRVWGTGVQGGYEEHVSCVECSDQHPGHARTTLCLTTLLAKTSPYNFPGWEARHARVRYVLPSPLKAPSPLNRILIGSVFKSVG